VAKLLRDVKYTLGGAIDVLVAVVVILVLDALVPPCSCGAFNLAFGVLLHAAFEMHSTCCSSFHQDEQSRVLGILTNFDG
jgi:hypothetical protein